jgi:hypothetical protein
VDEDAIALHDRISLVRSEWDSYLQVFTQAGFIRC